MPTRPLEDLAPVASPSIAFLRALIGEDAPTAASDPDDVLRTVRSKLENFLMPYEFGLKEVLTKVEILSGEFEATLPHNPIEHVKTRVKTMDSLLGKLVRTNCPPDLAEIKKNIRDIGGVRITCSYVEDCYKVARALALQPDITLLEEKDYIQYTKPNGYRSLHLIVEVPVFLSTGTVRVPIEIQIRTIAMDFWASAEHELIYKFKGELPDDMREHLRQIALTAASLDEQMGHVRARLTG
ncbi:MAG: GTP pyrophosphokinase family protein [Dermabacter sp.]|nr:GTP pyrophosphokinase family protein [Dermabacter sp.]